MDIIDPIAMEFVQEAATTRRMLERVPEEHFGWRPHARSMSLITLASHIAEIPSWVAAILEQDELTLDLDEYAPRIAANRVELIDLFEQNVRAASRLMKGHTNEHMMQLWRMKVAGERKFELPRVAVMRAMVLNHIVHHRGQLSVYLRLKDVPLPPVYGPTADEEA